MAVKLQSAVDAQMGQGIQERTKWNLWKTAFKNFQVIGLSQHTISLQIFKGCLPQTLLGPFLNTLPQMIFKITLWNSFAQANRTGKHFGR